MHMITLFRMLRLKQLKVKWELALMQFVNKQLLELMENSEELEKKLTDAFAGFITSAQAADGMNED